MRSNASHADRIHAAAMTAAALAAAAYWIDYFTKGHVRSSDDPSYVAFENAFPAADAYMALCFLVAARQLWQGKPAAVPAGIAAGSAMIFLGAMDTLWNLEHHSYRQRSPEMVVEAAINIGSFVLGPVTIVRLWRRRHALGA
jgi:hypothetical protein